ncbi:uncharacterized protein LOC117649467 [Thrips palmi]|uniref:Uncharacterized protein LOC117649467 n=1 Tax=Thrips palmi TaxID=161013 RepID=A0A6P8ZSH6_THRPL|nr:uncharacterized protein LOC117649467 [Thrips palmi]
MAAECCLCGLAFPLDRTAGVLACGHTACLPCKEDFSRRSETRCPQCCKKIRLDSGDNDAGAIQEHAITPWCLECDSPPTPSCLRDHTFCNVGRLVLEAVTHADALHDAVAVELQRAAHGVETLRTWTNAAAGREDLLAVRARSACVNRIRDVLQKAVEQIFEEVHRCQPESKDGPREETVKMERREPQDARGEMTRDDLEADAQNDALGPGVVFAGVLKQELDQQDEPDDDTSHLGDHTYSAGVHVMSTHSVDMNMDVSLHGICQRGTYIDNAAVSEITLPYAAVDLENVEVNVMSQHDSEMETDIDTDGIHEMSLHEADMDKASNETTLHEADLVKASNETTLHEADMDKASNKMTLHEADMDKASHEMSLHGADIDNASRLKISDESDDTHLIRLGVNSSDDVSVNEIPHENAGISMTTAWPDKEALHGDDVRDREIWHRGHADMDTGNAETNEVPAHGRHVNRGNTEDHGISTPGSREDKSRHPDQLCSDQPQRESFSDGSVEILGTDLRAETEDPTQSGIEHTQDGRCWLESLPESVLGAVLAYVPTTQLLSLRLLGRRWSNRVMAKAVWRHRRLSIPTCVQDTVPLAAILRLAPALDRLVLKMAYPPLRGLVGLEALAEGRCEIRSLHLTFVASSVSNKMIQRALGRRCFSLQALSITITRCCSTSDLAPVLRGIDQLRGLRTLKVNFDSPTRGFSFELLRLENFILVHPYRFSTDTARSIIMSSKDTLREVKLERCEPFSRVLQHCTRLDTLSVASCTGLAEVLPRLPAIQWVRIADLFRKSAVAWLRWTQSEGPTSVKTHVNVPLLSEDHFAGLLDLGGVLGGVHSMAVRPSAPLCVRPALVERLLAALPAVESLVLDVATDYEAVLRGWSAATVPALEELSIRVEEPSARSFVVRELNIMRPSLELCFI